MSPFNPEPWSEEALSALAALERPSRPRPLAGSRPAGPSTYVVERSVEEARQAFEGGEGEIPEGSSIKRVGVFLVVAAPLTTTGIVFSATSAGCMYTMLNQPSLEIQGFAATGHVCTYAPVALESQDIMSGEPKNLAASEFWVNDQPWLLIAGRLEEGRHHRRRDRAALLQTSFAEAQKQGDDFHPPTWPARFLFGPDGAARIRIRADEERIRVRVRRTHSLCSLMLDLGATPLSG